MKKLPRLLLLGTLCLLAALASADEPYAFMWEPSRGVTEWESDNVAEIRATEFVTLVASDQRGFTVSIARRDVHDALLVKITARSMDVGVSLGCALMSGDRVVNFQEQNLTSGQTWRDYFFEFQNAQHSLSVDRITFVFKHARRADISLIRVEGPSFADFFAVQGLSHRDVNYFGPYRIFGYPFTLWCYLILGLSAAALAARQIRKKRKYSLSLLALLFLALFVSYDLRNTYEQMFIMAETYRDYISRPAADKRFFWYDDMISFGSFLNAELPADAGDIHYLGDNDRFLYFRYLLYPRRLIHARDAAARYSIIYDPDNVVLSNNELVVDGRIAAKDGKAISFTPTAFIYAR